MSRPVRITYAVLLALLVLAVALLFVPVQRADASEPIPCEWYPPGWPEAPEWDAGEWSILEGDPAACATETIATEPVDEAPYVEPEFEIAAEPTTVIGSAIEVVNPNPTPRLTMPPTDTLP